MVAGKLWNSDVPQRIRTHHLRRDPRATLFVYGVDPSDRFSYLTLECVVSILEGPEVPELSRRLFSVMQAGMQRPPGTLYWEGTPRTEEEFVQIMADERRLIYQFEVTRTYGMF